MHFDTRELLAALEPPSFTHEGVRYAGRHLSLLEWARYMDDLDRLGQRRLNLLQLQVLYRRLVEAWFPPPPRPWWRPWPLPRGAPTPGQVFTRLPLEVQHRLITGFMASQARSLGLPAPKFGRSET